MATPLSLVSETEPLRTVSAPVGALGAAFSKLGVPFDVALLERV